MSHVSISIFQSLEWNYETHPCYTYSIYIYISNLAYKTERQQNWRFAWMSWTLILLLIKQLYEALLRDARNNVNLIV